MSEKIIAASTTTATPVVVRIERARAGDARAARAKKARSAMSPLAGVLLAGGAPTRASFLLATRDVDTGAPQYQRGALRLRK